MTRQKKTKILTMFVIDGNCVGRLMSLLIIWDHHRDI